MEEVTFHRRHQLWTHHLILLVASAVEQLVADVLSV